MLLLIICGVAFNIAYLEAQVDKEEFDRLMKSHDELVAELVKIEICKGKESIDK